MDSVPSWRTMKKLQDLIQMFQKITVEVEGFRWSLPERNDDYEKNR